MKAILIIEDHDKLRTSISSWLKELFPGVAVHQASSGEEGIAIAESVNPDVAIVDIGLPGIDGLEVIRRMKKSKLKTEALVLTCMEGDSYRKDSFEAGANSFISKKDTWTELPGAIRSLIESVKN